VIVGCAAERIERTPSGSEEPHGAPIAPLSDRIGGADTLVRPLRRSATQAGSAVTSPVRTSIVIGGAVDSASVPGAAFRSR
jgi:hypothetical protein